MVAELLATDSLNSLCRIQIRVLEQACTEEIHKKFPCRMLEPCPCTFLAELLAPHPVSRDYRAFFIIATELVASGLDNLIVALVYA